MASRTRSCPTDDTIAEFVDGRLSADAVGGVESHVGACDACRDLVAEMAKLSMDRRSVDEEIATARRRRPGAICLPTVAPGNYAIERELARGGMGRILEAWDCLHQRPVALKVSLHKTAKAASRFEREITITARLSHPAIIPLYAAGRWMDGEPFFAMKRVEGRSFADVAAGATALKDKLALLPHLLAVIEALAYAHGRGIVHRDLKPSNVLIGAFGETVVIDWGLAMEAGEDDPEDERTVGTPGFMPPEQARGEPVDARADVYALGALLYHLLAGAAPHGGGGARQALRAVLEGPPAALATLAPDAPPDLVTLVETAMAREPADRYPSAAQMADDLRRFVTGQLISAHSYTFGTLFRRWLSRHKAVLSVAALSVVVVVLLSVFAVRRVVDERDHADAARAVAQREQRAAVTQRDAAEQLVGYIITTLRTRLETLGRLDLLHGVGDEVDRYYESALPVASPDGPALVRRAIALQSLAAVETFKLDAPGAAPLFASAQRLLERAHALEPDNLDAEVELVHVHVSQAGALMDLGHTSDALGHAARAIEVGERALATHPSDPRAMAALSRGQLRRALVLRTAGRPESISAIYGTACALLERATAAAPSDLELRRQLGWAYLERGDSARMRGDNEEALSALRRSVEVREQLLAADPGASRRRDLAWSALRLAEVQARRGDFPAALASFQRVLGLREGLLADDPENPSLKRDVAITLQVLCNHENALGRSADAVAHGARAVTIIDALAHRQPDNPLTQADLGEILTSLGSAELDAHHEHQGLAHLTRAEDILSRLPPGFSPDATMALDLLGPILARARLSVGDAAGGRSAAERAVAHCERRTLEQPTNYATWAYLAGARMVLGDIAVARGDAPTAARAYRAAHEAFVRAASLGVDPPADVVRTAVAAVALAQVLAHTAGGRSEAHALSLAVVASLDPLDRARQLNPQGAKLLREARALLAQPR
jgi:tetratricopeptide (TPR) repeat protein